MGVDGADADFAAVGVDEDDGGDAAGAHATGVAETAGRRVFVHQVDRFDAVDFHAAGPLEG